MRPTSLLLSLGFAVLLGASSALAGTDEVTTTGGQVVKGEVIEENAEEVQIRPIGGGTMTFQREKVKHIKWDISHQPASYHRAKRLFESRQWDPAATTYEIALEDRNLRDLLKPYVYKNLAICYTHLSQSRHLTRKEADEYAKKAITAWEAVRGARGGKSPLLAEAIDKLVDIKMRLGKYDEVLKLLPDLEKLGKSHRGKASLLRASVQEAKRDFEAALEAYARVLERYEDDAALVNGARAGLVRCNLARNDPQAAEREAKRLLGAKPPPTDMAAAMAHLALGKLALVRLGARITAGRLTFDDRVIAAKIRLKKPETSPSGATRYYHKDMDAALLELLRPVVQYKADAQTEAEAAYLAARCFDLINVVVKDRSEKDAPKEAARHRNRAIELYDLLQRRRFNGLPWQKLAKDRRSLVR